MFHVELARRNAKRSRPFQFSLRRSHWHDRLAIACGPVCRTRVGDGGNAHAHGALPMALTVAVVYGRGYLRTFCIGGLFPCAPLSCVPVIGLSG